MFVIWGDLEEENSKGNNCIIDKVVIIKKHCGSIAQARYFLHYTVNF